MRSILPLLGLAGCIDFEIGAVKDEPVEGIRELLADPDSVNFGTLASPAPVTETVTVTSVGDVAVTIASIEVAGSSAYTLTWASGETLLEPEDTLELVVTYTPASFDDEAQIVIESDAVEPQLIVPLLGAGLYPAIEVTPSSVTYQSDFGEPVTEDVVVTSVGTADLEISSMLVQGSWFSAEGDIPATLAPGESLTLSTRYTPEVEDETVTGKLWLTTNTPEGFAVVPLEAHNGPLCIGLGEAWDRGVLGAQTSTAGTLRVENLSAEDELCFDSWYIYLSDDSQDMGAGDMDGDVGDDYPNGSIQVAAGDYQEFPGAAETDASWWCVEHTQYTTRNAEYEFIGAYVPEPLLSYMHAADQDAVWDWMDLNPVMIAARRTNYVTLGTAGGTAPVTLRILNMGSVSGDAYVRETIPDDWEATGFSREPLREEEGEDGATVYVWDVSLDAREETGAYAQTVYDEEEITYTLEVPPCEGRQYAPVMTSSWVDGEGTTRIASANPLVVNCVDE